MIHFDSGSLLFGISLDLIYVFALTVFGLGFFSILFTAQISLSWRCDLGFERIFDGSYSVRFYLDSLETNTSVSLGASHLTESLVDGSVLN